MPGYIKQLGAGEELTGLARACFCTDGCVGMGLCMRVDAYDVVVFFCDDANDGNPSIRLVTVTDGSVWIRNLAGKSLMSHATDSVVVSFSSSHVKGPDRCHSNTTDGSATRQTNSSPDMEGVTL